MFALRADLLDFTAAPVWGEGARAMPTGVRWRPDHWLLVDDQGRIQGTQPGHQQPGPQYRCEDHRGALLLPGFIDTHVHSPQTGVMASYGKGLLDWLNDYTFPAETAFSDADVARAQAPFFLDALLAHGTTSAAVFTTVHPASAQALFAAATARNMRLISGKVLMDRHAPAALCDDTASTAQAERDCVDLIDRWHDKGRNSVAVTVRFAATSSPAQLAMAGALCRANTSLYMQTHVAENRDEVRWVAELFPTARSYLDVYAKAGLLHSKAIFAHGIWLDDADRAALAASGAQVAFCPSSNLFLGSGLFDWRTAQKQGVAVSLASDVGGGTSLNMQRNMADAYKAQALLGARLDAYTALHSATLGAAKALGLTHEIGSFEAGTMADVCLWRWAASPLDTARQAAAKTLHEKFFAWMLLSDERHLLGTWVAGQQLYAAPTSALGK